MIFLRIPDKNPFGRLGRRSITWDHLVLYPFVA